MIEDLSRRTFGRLYVHNATGVKKNGQMLWICQCECGNIKHVKHWNLLGGSTRSCGCLQKELVAERKPGTKHGMAYSKEYRMLDGARQRSRLRGLPFDLELSDIVIPDTCPLLGTPMISPSLDRIDNSKGYTKDNVMVVSKRANTLKGDASLEELITLVNNLREVYKKKD